MSVQLVVDDGKSDRITVNDNGELVSTQHAITEYRVVESSPHGQCTLWLSFHLTQNLMVWPFIAYCCFIGYTWLELRPLTGRKHQLRVHCAEVLGTPILGDYKYGWQAHKTREPFVSPENTRTKTSSPFGLDMEGGDVSSKQPHLHLHSKQIDLPNICQLLEKLEVSSDSDISDLDSLKFDAPLPTHMQLSFNLLKSRVETCDYCQTIYSFVFSRSPKYVLYVAFGPESVSYKDESLCSHIDLPNILIPFVFPLISCHYICLTPQKKSCFDSKQAADFYSLVVQILQLCQCIISLIDINKLRVISFYLDNCGCSPKNNLFKLWKTEGGDAMNKYKQFNT